MEVNSKSLEVPDPENIEEYTFSCVACKAVLREKDREMKKCLLMLKTMKNLCEANLSPWQSICPYFSDTVHRKKFFIHVVCPCCDTILNNSP